MPLKSYIPLSEQIGRCVLFCIVLYQENFRSLGIGENLLPVRVLCILKQNHFYPFKITIAFLIIFQLLIYNRFSQFFLFSVFPITIPDGKSSQQVFDFIQKKLEFVAAEKVGSWNVDCEAYQSTQTTGMCISLIHHETVGLLATILWSEKVIVACIAKK